MRLKALIFDVDGTLADTERDGHRIAFNRSFEEAGLRWHWDQVLYGELLGITGGKERINHYIRHYHPGFTPRQGTLKSFIEQLHQKKTQYYLELLSKGEIPLRTGVSRLLREARDSGVQLAIATTTTLENVTGLLQTTLGKRAEEWFKVIAAGDLVSAKKPAPDIYLYTLSELALKAEDCLAIEDSKNGLASAKSAGIQTLITVNGYTCGQEFDGACAILDHLGDTQEPCRVIKGNVAFSPMVTINNLEKCMGN